MSGHRAEGTPAGDTAALRLAGERLTQMTGLRGLGWGTLSVLLRYPTAGLIEALRSGAVAKDLEEAVGWLDRDRELFVEPLAMLGEACQALADQDPAQLLTRLEVEYARLFVGPGSVPASPYESVYVDRDPSSGRPVVGWATSATVEALYRSHALHPSDQHPDLPDHIATELEFLYALCRSEGDAWANDDATQAKELRRAQQSFITDHLHPWVGEFCRRLTAAAREPVYPAVAGFLDQFVRVELGTGYAQSLRGVFDEPSQAGSGPNGAAGS